MLTRYTQGDLTWMDAVAPSPQEINSLVREFGLDHALTGEMSSPTPKSKVERFADCLYLVLHFPALRALHQRPEQEMDFIIGRKFLITVHYENIDPLHFFAKSFEVGTVLSDPAALHGGHLFTAMARSLYRSLSYECDALHRRLDETEEKIFAGKEREMVAHISRLGRILHDFRRALVSHRDMLESLESAGEKLLGAGFAYHVRAALGEEARVRRSLEHLREWLVELQETNNSLLELKQNDIMKNLTMMAFTTFPLTLISSIFAIGARHTPIVGMRYDFWIIVALMFALMLCFFLFFKYKKWL